MHKIHLALITLLFSSSSFAMLCPTNFKQIDVGDTLEQVKTQCGTPVSETTHDATVNVPQEWTYNKSITTNFKNQAMYGMKVTFDDEGVVVNIAVNGVAYPTTTFCDPKKAGIKLKDTIKQITAICGQPVFITKGESPSADGQKPGAAKITEAVYNNGATISTLVFENGIFKEIK